MTVIYLLLAAYRCHILCDETRLKEKYNRNNETGKFQRFENKQKTYSLYLPGTSITCGHVPLCILFTPPSLPSNHDIDAVLLKNSYP